MSDQERKLISQEHADKVFDLGENIAVSIEIIAQEVGLDVANCVLLIPPIVATMLRRNAKNEPGAIIRARDSIVKLIIEFTDIDENSRHGRRH